MVNPLSKTIAVLDLLFILRGVIELFVLQPTLVVFPRSELLPLEPPERDQREQGYLEADGDQ